MVDCSLSGRSRFKTAREEEGEHVPRMNSKPSWMSDSVSPSYALGPASDSDECQSDRADAVVGSGWPLKE